ncbi:hypothetical protein ACH4E7_00815 [Kitasatospora sp. NPDC018058]
MVTGVIRNVPGGGRGAFRNSGFTKVDYRALNVVVCVDFAAITGASISIS